MGLSEKAATLDQLNNLSIEEKQELAKELSVLQSVQRLTNQQKGLLSNHQSAGQQGQASDALTAQKFAEIQELCAAVVQSDVSPEAKAKIQSILDSISSEFSFMGPMNCLLKTGLAPARRNL